MSAVENSDHKATSPSSSIITDTVSIIHVSHSILSSGPRSQQPDPRLPSPLLSVPCEVRDEIYARFIYRIYATAIPSPRRPFQHPLLHYGRHVALNDDELNPDSGSLHLVCHQIHAEYLEAQCKHAQHFWSTPSDWPWVGTERLPVKIPLTPGSFTVRIQNLEMRFERVVSCKSAWNTLHDQHATMRESIEDVCALLPALRKLTVTLCLRTVRTSVARLGTYLHSTGPDKRVMSMMDGTRMYVTDLVLAIVPPTKIAPNLREVRNRLVTPNVAELPIQEQIFVREPGVEGFERMMGRTRKAENMAIGFCDWAHNWRCLYGSFPTTIKWDLWREHLKNALEEAERTGKRKKLRRLAMAVTAFQDS